MDVKTSTERSSAAARCSPSCCSPTSPTPRTTPSRPRRPTTSCSCSADEFGVAAGQRAARGRGRGTDDSNPVIDVNHDACILCDRCVRACDDIQGNDVIGRSGKGYTTRIAFDLNDPMGELVRDLRRVRGGLPDRRAHQQGDRRRADPAAREAAPGRQRLPVLRRRLRAHLLRRRRAEGDLVRRGPRPARLPEPAVREGPLRLGLRGLAAASDDAADPPRVLVPEGAAVDRRARRREPAGARSARPQARRPGRLRRGDAVTSARPPGTRRSSSSRGG